MGNNMMAKRLSPNVFLPVLILPLWALLFLHEQMREFTIFSISIILLSSFTVLISRMLKNKNKSAPELMARTLTFWWMVALFLIGVVTPPLVSIVAIGLCSSVALYEYLSFERKPTQTLSSLSSKFVFFLIPLNLFFSFRGKSDSGFILMMISLLLILPVLLVLEGRTENASHRYGRFASAMVFFVFGLGLSAPLLLQNIMILILCFFLTEVRDLISYWMGKYLAKAYQKKQNSFVLRVVNFKIAEAISPNKTWGVGFLSGLVLIALGVSLRDLLNVSLSFMILWSVVIAVLGLFGDLVFSLFKREVGIKDSGTLLPGKTGILDRIDSLVLTIPATYFLFYFFYF